MEDTTTQDNWRENMAETLAEPLTIENGETVEVEWKSEGSTFTPSEASNMKPAVIFLVQVEGNDATRKIYARGRLLKAIYKLGHDLTGKRCKIAREGEGIDTEWTLTTE